MKNNRMELALHLAEEALRRHFTDKKDICREFRQIRQECLDSLSVSNMHRIYAKLIRMELNERAVQVAIHLLTEEKKRYLNLKYRRKKSPVALSIALHVSTAQLNLWHRCILGQVARFMLYMLASEDVFHPGRVAQMVRLQSEAIKFFSELDPAGDTIDKSWMLALTFRHKQYRSLMASIEDAMSREPKSMHESIVVARLSNPDEPAAFVADSCRVNKGAVSRHLREFGEKMSKYLK